MSNRRSVRRSVVSGVQRFYDETLAERFRLFAEWNDITQGGAISMVIVFGLQSELRLPQARGKAHSVQYRIPKELAERLDAHLNGESKQDFIEAATRLLLEGVSSNE